MSKEKFSFRVPEHLAERIKDIDDENGFDNKSEAARHVLRRGIEHEEHTTAGEQLGRQTTGVAGVGTVVAAIAAVMGQPWAVGLVIPFGVATFVFSLVWASVKTLEGRDLV